LEPLTTLPSTASTSYQWVGVSSRTRKLELLRVRRLLLHPGHNRNVERVEDLDHGARSRHEPPLPGACEEQKRLRVVAFAFLTPFFFIKGGLNFSLLFAEMAPITRARPRAGGARS